MAKVKLADKGRKLEHLRAELAQVKKSIVSVREDLRFMQEKAIDYRNKRNEFNKLAKQFSTETKEKREERDSLNKEVAFQKAVRQALWDQVNQITVQIRQIRDTIPQALPYRRSRLAERSMELEWKLQTTPMSIDQEKNIVHEISQIEGELSVLHDHNKKKVQIEQLITQIEALRNKADKAHEKVTHLATQSQQIHDSIVDKIRKIEENRKAADNYHENYIKQQENIDARAAQLDEFQTQYGKLLAEIRTIEYENRQKKKLLAEQKINNLRKTKITKAEEKFKSGKKMTFNEYLLLQSSKGEDNEKPDQA